MFNKKPLYAPDTGASTGAGNTPSKPTPPLANGAGTKAGSKPPVITGAGTKTPAVAKGKDAGKTPAVAKGKTPAVAKPWVRPPAPAIAKAQPLAKPNRANLIMLTAFKAHPGIGWRKDRWDCYYPGLTLFDCMVIDGLDHTQAAFYGGRGKDAPPAGVLLTLVPLNDADAQKVIDAVKAGTYQPPKRPADFVTPWRDSAPDHLKALGQR